MHIGILGGGQLGRMMALAGYPLGQRFTVLDPAESACASDVAGHIHAPYDDNAGLRQLAEQADLLTWDFENVPVAALEGLGDGIAIAPPLTALAVGQDRLAEKNLFTELGLGTPEFAAVDSRPDLLQAVERIGLPAILKTRRFGYDGKGQAVLRTREDLEPAWQKLGGRPLILEAFVPFDYECSVIGVRNAEGDFRCYPLSRNLHHNGVLSVTAAPLAAPAAVAAQSQQWMERMMTHFAYIGVLTLELFVVGERLLVNEMAPRVHNSGHWTMDGAVTSQFENHLRAISGLPLGACDALGHSMMLNWIGDMPAAGPFLQIPGLHWHDYGKHPRPGRKLGHANLVAADLIQLRERARQLQPLLSSGAWQRVTRVLGLS
ncbi:MAG: 5-(carboxyamino)imidazole ribonucleotide synthase [Wenzhouxiangellaceae bacterium]